MIDYIKYLGTHSSNLEESDLRIFNLRFFWSKGFLTYVVSDLKFY